MKSREEIEKLANEWLEENGIYLEGPYNASVIEAYLAAYLASRRESIEAAAKRADELLEMDYRACIFADEIRALLPEEKKE